MYTSTQQESDAPDKKYIHINKFCNKNIILFNISEILIGIS